MQKLLSVVRGFLDRFRIGRPKVRAGARASEKRKAIREFYRKVPEIHIH